MILPEDLEGFVTLIPLDVDYIGPTVLTQVNVYYIHPFKSFLGFVSNGIFYSNKLQPLFL
jgi:hypothetical protein